MSETKVESRRLKMGDSGYFHHHHYDHEGPAVNAPSAKSASVGPLVEEGSAFLSLTAQSSERVSRPRQHFDVIVIGAGQSGLSVGYHFAQRGLRFAILDANARVGDSWRNRWDSLRLFTAAGFDGLIGMPFPAPRFSFPTKDEMADYLESYAKRFALPILHGTRVGRLTRDGDLYVVEAGDHVFTAAHVVVAMATYQKGRFPEFARELDSGILQLHSSDYRNPSQLRPGGVLLVGAGNSGAEIALDVTRDARWAGSAFAPVYLSGRSTGHVPFRIDDPLAQRFLAPLVLRGIFHRLLTLDTRLGRKARPKIVSRGGPLIRARPEDLKEAGIQRVPRVAGVRDGRPLLDDGRVLQVSNVIWATGFHAGFEWIDLPIARDEHGEPVQWRGVVKSEPGLYFVGLHFLYAFSSTMIHGIARDAKHVADAVIRRLDAAGRARALRETRPRNSNPQLAIPV
jgi:putative flavoprotein involved in K+ transport